VTALLARGCPAGQSCTDDCMCRTVCGTASSPGEMCDPPGARRVVPRARGATSAAPGARRPSPLWRRHPRSRELCDPARASRRPAKGARCATRPAARVRRADSHGHSARGWDVSPARPPAVAGCSVVAGVVATAPSVPSNWTPATLGRRPSRPVGRNQLRQRHLRADRGLRRPGAGVQRRLLRAQSHVFGAVSAGQTYVSSSTLRRLAG